MRLSHGICAGALLVMSLSSGSAADAPLPEGAVARIGSPKWRHPGSSIKKLVYAPDGKRLLSYGDSGTAVLWDVATGKPAATFRGPDHVLVLACVSPDGTRLATIGVSLTGPTGNVGTPKYTARVWDAKSGKEIRSFAVDTSAQLALTPDATELVTGYVNRLTRYATADGKELGRFESKGLVTLLPDGKRAIEHTRNGTDQRSRIVDVASAKELSFVPSRALYCSVASTDGKTVVLGSLFSNDCELLVWDVEGGKQVKRFVAPEKLLPKRLELSADGNRLYGVGSNGRFVMSLGDGKVHFVEKSSDPFAIMETDSALSPDGSTIAEATGPLIEFRDAATGKPVGDRDPGQPRHALGALAVSPDSKHLLTLASAEVPSKGGYIRCWELATGKLDRTLPDPVNHFGYMPDGKALLVAKLTGTGNQANSLLELWDPASGKKIDSFAEVKGAVNGFRFTDDGKTLFTFATERGAKWDVSTKKSLGSFSTPFNPEGYTPDGKFVLWRDYTGAPREIGLGAKHDNPPLPPIKKIEGDPILNPAGTTWVAVNSETGKTFLWNRAEK